MSNRRNDDSSRNNGTSNTDDPPMSRKISIKLISFSRQISLFLCFRLYFWIVDNEYFDFCLFCGRIRMCVCVRCVGLFIICNKNNTEDDFREAFEKFGKIEEIYTIKDRNTGDNKGISMQSPSI